MSRPESGGPPPEITPPPGVEVRAATRRDARAVLAHIAEVAAEGRYIRSEDVTRERARRITKSLRSSWTEAGVNLVAFAEGRLIGTLSAARESSRQTRHVASLGMSVDKDWRGRGVGSALMAELFRWATWAGVEKLALTVYPHNQRAANLYKKFGFVEEGRLSGHSKKAYGYEDEVVMGRWL